MATGLFLRGAVAKWQAIVVKAVREWRNDMLNSTLLFGWGVNWRDAAIDQLREVLIEKQTFEDDDKYETDWFRCVMCNEVRLETKGNFDGVIQFVCNRCPLLPREAPTE